ncbi:MAG: hypothetical protein B6I38_08800 [Anaerolineaceae bacterium 4572_5.1]|nr:MAG: hypothetical protein B6I38_08800 [Anaerolineaceae bacterium 4572_5.1]
MPSYKIRLLENINEMQMIEKLMSDIWRGGAEDAVPSHILIALIHNGGLALGAFEDDEMVGFVFGFPGISKTPQGFQVKHCSHQMGVHPDHRGKDIGFALKKAQWQMARQQGLDLITWTYDPLLSKNAHINIARLGAVCNTYRRNEYGNMVDELNAGLASDRFQVDWRLNTKRVKRRLGNDSRAVLGLSHYDKADTQYLYAPDSDSASGLLRPPKDFSPPNNSLALIEIPSDFQTLRGIDLSLAQDWRFFTRKVFEESFNAGYLVTDFIYDRAGKKPRSLYVLSHGESTIG